MSDMAQLQLEYMRSYLAEIGRKGGLAGAGIKKRRTKASYRAAGRKGGKARWAKENRAK